MKSPMTIKTLSLLILFIITLPKAFAICVNKSGEVLDIVTADDDLLFCREPLRFSDQNLKKNIKRLKYDPNLINKIQYSLIKPDTYNDETDLSGIAAILTSEIKSLRAEVHALKKVKAGS